MRHDRVCGDNITIEVFFSYLNPLEILLTFLASFAFTFVNAILNFFLKQTLRWPGLPETVGAVYHGFVLVNIFAYMVKTLKAPDVGAACDFPIISSALFYAPYVFSSSQLVFTMAGIFITT